MPKKIDLTGKRFGRLVVVKDSGIRKRANVVWSCKCDCGNLVLIRSQSLICGDTQSCGCLFVEASMKSVKKMQIGKEDTELVEATSLCILTSRIYSSNTSGVKGVCWARKKQKWSAYIFFQGIRYHLGYFDKLEDATKARKLGEEKYFTPILEKYGRLEATWPQ